MSKDQKSIEDLLIGILNHAVLHITFEEIGDMQKAQFHDESARALYDELLQILLEGYQLQGNESASDN